MKISWVLYIGFFLQNIFAAPLVAKNFVIDTSRGVVWLRVLSSHGKSDFQSFALCPQGKCSENIPKNSTTISIPIQRAVCLASAQLGFMEALDLRGKIVGVSQSEFVYDSILKITGKRGDWKAVGSEDQLDWERVIELHPDVIFYSAPPGQSTKMVLKAKELHIPILPTAEWLENSPLGRAEWLKVYGLLFGRQLEADSLFNKTKKKYDSLKTNVSEQKKSKPTAMVGLSWRGIWYVSGGKSYAAQFLKDAGIDYLWAEDSHTGSLSLSLENVLERGRKADLWINPEGAVSLEALKIQEPRSAHFLAFQKGQVYINDFRRNAEGGNDYWESAITYPDLILADLINIAQGKLDSAHAHYYRKLPEKKSR